MRTLGSFVNDILDVAETEQFNKHFTRLMVDTISADRVIALKALRIAQDYTHSDNKRVSDFGLMVLYSIHRNNSTLRSLAQATIAKALPRRSKTPPLRRRFLDLVNKFWEWCKL